MIRVKNECDDPETNTSVRSHFIRDSEAKALNKINKFEILQDKSVSDDNDVSKDNNVSKDNTTPKDNTISKDNKISKKCNTSKSKEPHKKNRRWIQLE